MNLTDVVQIVVNSYSNGNAFALKADGTVWSWGKNNSGILGLGDAADHALPSQVAGLSNVVAVAPGLAHTLALLSDGTMRAWGYNGLGRLNDGTTSDRRSPVVVKNTSNVIAIAAGQHSMVIKADGTLYTWGDNTWGELGQGNATNYTTPRQVASLAPVINHAPTVSLSLNTAQPVIAPAAVTLNALAADSDGSISKVEFFNTETLLGSSSAAPYQLTLSALPIGSYAFQAVATDNNGGIGQSTVLSLSVLPPTIGSFGSRRGLCHPCKGRQWNSLL